MRRTLGVFGGGAWGRAFAAAVAESFQLVFWDRDAASAAEAAADCGGAAEDFDAVVSKAQLIIIAVNSGGFSDVFARVVEGGDAPIVWLTKGFDPLTNRPLCDVAAELAGERNFAAISGPSFADEVAQGLPAALALAANNRQAGEALREQLNHKNLRLYLEDDLTGLCVGGAVKNIIAIAAGVCDGMQLGHNARAALITRGLSEMCAIGTALGGKMQTFFGLSGIGDLTLTCTSDKSRNRQLGLRLGANAAHIHTADDIAAIAADTCEGMTAVRPLLAAIAPYQLQTPIIQAVAAVLRGEDSPAAMAEKLLARPPAH